MTTFKKDPTASPRTAQPTTRIPSTGDLALTPARHSGQRYLCLHRRLRTVASARVHAGVAYAEDRSTVLPLVRQRSGATGSPSSHRSRLATRDGTEWSVHRSQRQP